MRLVACSRGSGLILQRGSGSWGAVLAASARLASLSDWRWAPWVGVISVSVRDTMLAANLRGLRLRIGAGYGWAQRLSLCRG